jgi:hypothetical protein
MLDLHSVSAGDRLQLAGAKVVKAWQELRRYFVAAFPRGWTVEQPTSLPFGIVVQILPMPVCK